MATNILRLDKRDLKGLENDGFGRVRCETLNSATKPQMVAQAHVWIEVEYIHRGDMPCQLEK